jgi:hypothetical protein
MCFSEKISWITLLLGSIINIILILLLSRISNPRVIIPIMLIVGWQYALLMQIPDALAWRNSKASYPGKLAFVLNTTQPIILIIVVAIILTKLQKSFIWLIPSLLLCIVYSIYVIKETPHINFDVTPESSCSNLSYRWWSKLPTSLYYIIMITTALAIPSAPFVAISLFLFVSTILVSAKVVSKGCNIGSLWCWSVASAGLVIGISGLLMNKLKIL